MVRVAFFPDSFHEANGVARTCRTLEGIARRRGLPFFTVRCGETTRRLEDGSTRAFELARGNLSFSVETDLNFDLGLWRYVNDVRRAVREFNPDVVHVTGPSDIGQMGVRIAKSLRVPIVMSWHTNLHEYAGRRLEKILKGLPELVRDSAGAWAERESLRATMAFYRFAKVCLAPNAELVKLVEEMTGRRTFLMRRGIDAELFSPEKRTRGEGGPVRLGFVGRLSTEKNVRLIAEAARALRAAGHAGVEFYFIGEGSERGWLEANVPGATLTGILRGEELSRAYADLDVFLFPSRTDTFGNVILEALASGVPCVVTDAGGPKFLIEDGVCGLVTATDADFIAATIRLASDADLRAGMRAAASAHARRASWDAVFDEVATAWRAAVEKSR